MKLADVKEGLEYMHTAKVPEDIINFNEYLLC
jgi:hypothetical protein